MSRYWVISDNGERFGPAELDVLKQWVREGRVSPTTLIGREGEADVHPASQIPEISDVIPATQAIASHFQQMEPVLRSRHWFNEFPVWAVVLLTIFVPFFGLIWLGLLHGQLPKNRVDDPGAEKAIGFCFIPFFNIWYWNFFLHPRLVLRVNEQRMMAGMPPANLSGLAMTMCILYACFFPMICVPFFSTLLILAATIVKCIFAASVQSAVNELAIAQRQRGFEVAAPTQVR